MFTRSPTDSLSLLFFGYWYFNFGHENFILFYFILYFIFLSGTLTSQLSNFMLDKSIKYSASFFLKTLHWIPDHWLTISTVTTHPPSRSYDQWFLMHDIISNFQHSCTLFNIHLIIYRFFTTRLDPIVLTDLYYSTYCLSPLNNFFLCIIVYLIVAVVNSPKYSVMQDKWFRRLRKELYDMCW